MNEGGRMNECDEERKTKAEEKRIRDIVREEIRNAQLALETPVKKEPDKSAEELEFEKWEDEAYCLAAVQQNGYALQHVHAQTEAIALAAVQQNGHALQYVHDQTAAICLAAVQQNGYALRFVHDKPLFLKLLAESKKED
jgi:hypothetical protein